MIVYWLHRKLHDNIINEGYVGVTNRPKQRKKEYLDRPKKHNIHLQRALDKYDDVIFETIFEGSKRECLDYENELRPEKNIGWNIAIGGSIPPNHTGFKRSEETKKLISINNVGMKGQKHSEETKAMYRETRKGNIPVNAKPVHTPEGIFRTTGQAAQALGVHASTIINRAKSSSKKFDEYYYLNTHNTPGEVYV